ncbi:MAG: M23 family metallopeptidase [Saprospiraceae bacterium]|jgi:murein DD-endopeptidase MepM/ murein hydrolase activator NlpD|nr:M23 family metallopeptidase [Saprospiraceae bacterium]MBK8669499.1 M23 family metallopeptidase [Saprospiraceae bacterium]MBL0098920.1 M23 family metallopeptidase [Saprospiraceae bacterium]
MPDGLQIKRKLWDRLRDTYRISILDDENLEEVGSYNLSLLSFYILISVLALLLSVLVISFIVFTPVKRLIPGYGDISDNKKFIELSKKVDELEKEVDAYDTYTAGLKNMLTGGIYNSSVEKIDSVAELKNIRPELVNQADVMETKRAKELDFLKFATPVTGKVSASFQPSVQHYGVDIVAARDTPIKSIMDGVVINADQSVNTGNCVYIQHNKNVVSVYKHNSVLLVKTGDIVKTGQAVAIIGNSGELSTGPHLHFEMWYDGKYVNPENYITFQ